MIFHWDPSPIAFEIPFFHLYIHWYGICFGLGLLLSSTLGTYLLKQNLFEKVPTADITPLVDKFFLYGCIGLLIGARLIHVLFYDWDYFRNSPSKFFSIWEGGLASHGGTLGVLIGLWYAYKKTKVQELYHVRLLQLFDIASLSVFPAASLIRIGNFFNQEIVGIPTSHTFGVLFGHPIGIVDSLVPRHPVQLYEAVCYFILGSFCLWKKNKILSKPGLGLGIVLVSFFSVRFLLEFLKTPQALFDISSILSTGQYLSLPLILTGIVFVRRALKAV